MPADDLLVHYNRELLSIRRAAAAFAAEHPRIAGRLRLSEDAVEDPHVGRLIEAFAYLTARVRQKLDDDFPELTDAMLGVLYPHYRQPIPSMAILQMELAADLPAAQTVPAHTLIDTEPVEDERCRFRTAFATQLHPIAVRSAQLAGRPLTAPVLSGPQGAAAQGAAACLRLSLELTVPDIGFGEAAPEKLRFFLRGQPQLVFPLYELLLNDTVAIAFAAGANDPDPAVLGPEALSPAGFGLDEGVLPYAPGSHPAYRLLSEYFAFPEKFLFVDLAFPAAQLLAEKGRSLDVFVYLRRSPAGLERAVGAAAFALGCTPVVNLFPQVAEPIAVSHVASDYRIVPDSRRPRGLEVWRVEGVQSVDGDGRRQALQPLYSVRHAMGEDGPSRAGQAGADPVWWYTQRRPGAPGQGGSELHLSLCDPALNPSAPPDRVLAVEVLCLNRDLPERLPFGGGHPHLRTVAPAPAIGSLRLLTAPTPTLRPDFGEGGRWRLISHLTLNHLSLVSDGGAAALKEMLLLYDFRGSAETQALIDGILSVSSRHGTARVKDRGNVAFCRGIDIALTFDETHFSGNGVFLMASVLERFFGLYANVNSFSRLTASVRGRTGTLRTWPARAGDRILL